MVGWVMPTGASGPDEERIYWTIWLWEGAANLQGQWGLAGGLQDNGQGRAWPQGRGTWSMWLWEPLPRGAPSSRCVSSRACQLQRQEQSGHQKRTSCAHATPCHWPSRAGCSWEWVQGVHSATETRQGAAIVYWGCRGCTWTEVPGSNSRPEEQAGIWGEWGAPHRSIWTPGEV